jgi:hypothetical protein
MLIDISAFSVSEQIKQALKESGSPSREHMVISGKRQTIVVSRFTQ